VELGAGRRYPVRRAAAHRGDADGAGRPPESAGGHFVQALGAAARHSHAGRSGRAGHRRLGLDRLCRIVQGTGRYPEEAGRCADPGDWRPGRAAAPAGPVHGAGRRHTRRIPRLHGRRAAALGALDQAIGHPGAVMRAPEEQPMYVTEPSRQVPLHGEYDVVVLGGGPAGLLAAASAARNGASVLLLERYGFLGGMGTAAGVSNFCGLHANVHGDIRQVVHGMADELLDRMRALDGLNDPHLILGKIHAQAYDISAFKCAADGLLRDSGAQVLFHALAGGIVRGADGAVDALLLETKSGRRAVRGRVFIDCSGDADLAHWACLPFEKGDRQGHMMYPTLMFKVGNVDGERAREAWKIIPQLMDEAEASGDFRFPRRGAIVRPQKHDYEWRVNVTQLSNPDGSAADGTDARSLSAGELEGRRQIVDYLAF